MSISSKITEPEDEKFADIVYTDNNEATSAPAPTQEAEDTATKEKQDKLAPKKDKKKVGLFDSVLLLALLGCIGGGAYFVYTKMNEFKIPTPMEEEVAIQEELKQQIETLHKQNAAAQIPQRLALKKENAESTQQLNDKNTQLAELEQSIKQLEQECKHAEQALETAKAEFVALDKQQRKEAMELLKGDGIAIGPITTDDKESLNNAILKKDGNEWKLSGNNGCYNRPIKLSKYNSKLPLIVHYARGKKDLITKGVIPEQTAEEIAAEREKLDREAIEQSRNYDPVMAPTVVTQSSESTDIVEEDTTAGTDDTELNTEFETAEPAENAAEHTMPDEQLPW